MKHYSFITESRSFKSIPYKKIGGIFGKKRFSKNPKYSKSQLDRKTIEDATEYVQQQNEIEKARHGYSFSIPKRLYKQGDGVHFITDPQEASAIQKQYQDAISRTSTYIGDLENHLLRGNGVALRSPMGDYVCGFPKDDVFVLSHFAPKTLRSGMEFIKSLAQKQDKIIMAVPDYQANMAVKCGFRIVGKVPQMFDGQIVMKNVCVNRSITPEDIQKLTIDLMKQ